MTLECADIGGRVDAAIRFKRTAEKRRNKQSVATQSDALRDFGIAVDIDPPALVDVEMQMQQVELPPGKEINARLEFIHRVESACDVDQDAAPAEARHVSNGAAHRKAELMRHLARANHHLRQRDQAI